MKTKSAKITATTIIRMTDLSDPSTAPGTVATFGADDYEAAKQFFFNEIQKIAKRHHISVDDDDLADAEDAGYFESQDEYIFLVHSFAD